jgi:hypothetical protein
MIMQDNTVRLSWANGIAEIGRSKHVDFKLHHVQHLVQSEDITLQQVGPSGMKVVLFMLAYWTHQTCDAYACVCALPAQPRNTCAN